MWVFWDRIKVFKIISECKITKTQIFILVTTRFLTEKMVKNGYQGNEGFGSAWDRIEGCQTGPFITTNFEQVNADWYKRMRGEQYFLSFFPPNRT